MCLKANDGGPLGERGTNLGKVRPGKLLQSMNFWDPAQKSPFSFVRFFFEAI